MRSQNAVGGGDFRGGPSSRASAVEAEAGLEDRTLIQFSLSSCAPQLGCVQRGGRKSICQGWHSQQQTHVTWGGRSLQTIGSPEGKHPEAHRGLFRVMTLNEMYNSWHCCYMFQSHKKRGWGNQWWRDKLHHQSASPWPRSLPLAPTPGESMAACLTCSSWVWLWNVCIAGSSRALTGMAPRLPLHSWPSGPCWQSPTPPGSHACLPCFLPSLWSFPSAALHPWLYLSLHCSLLCSMHCFLKWFQVPSCLSVTIGTQSCVWYAPYNSQLICLCDYRITVDSQLTSTHGDW